MIANALAAVQAAAPGFHWDIFWINLFTALPPTVAAVAALVQVYRNRKQAVKDKEAVEQKLDHDKKEVKDALEQESQDVKRSLATASVLADDRFSKVEALAQDTHTLVNKNMGIQLKLTCAVSKRLAQLTGKPEDHEAATAAEKIYEEHMKQQALVDRAVDNRKEQPK